MREGSLFGLRAIQNLFRPLHQISAIKCRVDDKIAAIDGLVFRAARTGSSFKDMLLLVIYGVDVNGRHDSPSIGFQAIGGSTGKFLSVSLPSVAQPGF